MRKKITSPLADYIRPVIDAKYRTRSEAAENIGIAESVINLF